MNHFLNCFIARVSIELLFLLKILLEKLLNILKPFLKICPNIYWFYVDVTWEGVVASVVLDAASVFGSVIANHGSFFCSSMRYLGCEMA